MTIDTIAARNKRIAELEALYDREMRRAVDAEAEVEALKEINRSLREERRQAEARVAELERELAELRQ